MTVPTNVDSFFIMQINMPEGRYRLRRDIAADELLESIAKGVLELDERIIEHARILVNWSTRVERGEMVLVRAPPNAHDLVVAISAEVASKGASCMVSMDSDEITKAYLENADEETISLYPQHYARAMSECDVIITVEAPIDSMTLSSMNPEKIIARSRTRRPLLDMMMERRWCDTVHPCEALAKQANMTLKEYRDFVYDSILIDWEETSCEMSVIRDRLGMYNDIRIIGQDTDLYAETRGRVWAVASGKNNMPCGEVYTSPLEDTVEGKIRFDIPFLYQGTVVGDVKLMFERGEVVDYAAGKGERTLKAIIEADEGAKRLGEIAFGMNKGITKYTMNMLFDEKMRGTIHCGLGKALKECNGSNESAIHVDMLKSMQTGEIIIGDEVIYKDGRFFNELG
jgi:aminopeptidase